jgi:hypothetical protein
MTASTPDIHNTLRLRRLGIETHQEAVVYMRDDCPARGDQQVVWPGIRRDRRARPR